MVDTFARPGADVSLDATPHGDRPELSATPPTRIAPIEATEIENEAARHQVIDKILKYNEEDLAATWAVLQWVRDFGRGGAHGVCE